MKSTFRVEIYTPNELFFCDEAEALKVSGLDGDYGIMKNHVPAVIALKEGHIQITRNSIKQHFVSGAGYLELKNNLAKIFVADCERDEKEK